MGYKNPKDQVRFMHRWYLKNKGRVRKSGRKWRLKNPEMQMILSAKLRAKKFKVPFTITVKDVHIPTVCPIFGTPLKKGAGPLCDSSPSLDRIIPQLGYVPGNIKVISNKANSIKRNATSKEIRMVADWLETFEKKADD